MNLSNLPSKTIVFLKEVRLEMKKVNWPTRQETIKYTLIVVGISLVIAIYLGGIDFVLSVLRQKFLIK